MFALTLRHPYAFAVCRCGKRIENREWLPPAALLAPGDWLAIHGGVPPTSESKREQLVIDAFAFPGIPATLTLEDILYYSGVVAVAVYHGYVTESADPWFEGPYGWVLKDLVVLPQPVPCRGHQKLWPLPADVHEAVRGQYQRARKAVAP